MQHVQRTRHALMAFSMVVAMLLVGCGPQEGAGTPSDAVVKFLHANSEHDADQVIALVKGSEAKTNYLKAMVNLAAVKSEFDAALNKHLGEDSAAQVQLQTTINNPFAIDNVDQALENMEIDEQDNSATASFEGNRNDLKLTREEERWYIDLSDEFSMPEEALQQRTNEFTTMASVLEENMSEIEAEDATVGSITRQIAQDFNAAMQEDAQQDQPEE